jgi:predicted ATPase
LQSQQPLLLIMDDLQWADAQSLQLLDQVVDFVPGLAMLICAQARPEFQHTWESRAYYHSIVLQPLSPEDSAALVRAALGDKDIAGGLSRQADLIGRADGNPFYLTELAHAADRQGDGKLPPTLHGLIVERIDALEKEARQILELASVIGREFPNRLLIAVSETDQLEAQISRLQELEFVYQKEIVPELIYLFKHYLTQQATYESILIQCRKDLHKRIGAAIENEYKESLDNYYAVLAQHYEKAGEYQLAFDYYRRAGDPAKQGKDVSDHSCGCGPGGYISEHRFAVDDCAHGWTAGDHWRRALGSGPRHRGRLARDFAGHICHAPLVLHGLS